MKKFSFILPVMAFLLAIGAAFGSALFQSGFYDSNGSTPLGGVSGTIDQSSEDCQVQSGVICTIDEEWAFRSKEEAEANQGAQTNEMAPGLLKYVP